MLPGNRNWYFQQTFQIERFRVIFLCKIKWVGEIIRVQKHQPSIDITLFPKAGLHKKINI